MQRRRLFPLWLTRSRRNWQLLLLNDATACRFFSPLFFSNSLLAKSDVAKSLGAVCLSDDAPKAQPQEISCKQACVTTTTPPTTQSTRPFDATRRHVISPFLFFSFRPGWLCLSDCDLWKRRLAASSIKMRRCTQMNEFEHRSLELNAAGVTRLAVTRSSRVDDRCCLLFLFLPHGRILIKGPSPPPPPKKKLIRFRFAAGRKAGVKYLACSRSAS